MGLDFYWALSKDWVLVSYCCELTPTPWIFMNDIVIFLLNLSHLITLPIKDKALNPLHLILAFLP